MTVGKQRTLVLLAVLVGFSLCVGPAREIVGAQEQFQRGQNVTPVYEGWRKNKDGTITMVFGYFNRNWQEVVDIPVGPDNFFEPGPADRGQMSHFYVRRNLYMLEVVVPADWGDKELIWTLNFRGKTEKARGKLLPVWIIDDAVIRGNRGGNILGDVPREFDVDNQPPTIKVGGSLQRTVAVGEPVSLSVEIADDGLEPTPPWANRRSRGGIQSQTNSGPGPPGRGGARGGGGDDAGIQAARGDTVAFTNVRPVVTPPGRGQRPGVTWVQHRGIGDIKFSNMRPQVVDGKATVTATFAEPGTYVLRAYADDGIRMTPADVTVTVTGPGAKK